MICFVRVDQGHETERVRLIWERLAPRYDKDITFFEKVLFAGGREWVCSQAKGDVLEIAVGTGRNFAYYPPDVHLTGIDLSASMLNIARQRADQLGRQVDLRWATLRLWSLPTRPSTPLSSPFPSAPSPTTGRPLLK